MSDCVLDASVAVKLAVREDDSDQALNLTSSVTACGGSLFILDIAVAETVNAIWIYHRKSLLTAAEAELAVIRFLTLPLQNIAFRPLAPDALNLAMKYSIAVYDAAFVAAVQQRRC